MLPWVSLFDCVALGVTTVCNSLREVLETKSVTKLAHDIHRDAQALHDHAGINIAGVLDTQIVFEILSDDNNYCIGFNKLLEWLDKPVHSSKRKMHRAMDADQNFWKNRPLPEAALEYAAQDVRLLRDAGSVVMERLGARVDDALQASAKRVASAARNQGKRKIVFDQTQEYRLRSAEVMEQFAPEAIASRSVRYAL